MLSYKPGAATPNNNISLAIFASRWLNGPSAQLRVCTSLTDTGSSVEHIHPSASHGIDFI